MFNKPKRTFRGRRAQRSDSEDEVENKDVQSMEIDREEPAKIESAVVRKPKKKKSDKTTSVLSFGAEGKTSSVLEPVVYCNRN